MVGFIVMIDEFHDENGATCFLPGSHRGFTDASRRAEGPPRVVSACGPAGSVIVYNGSALHGHGANRTSRPRRSIQGAFIRRTAPSGVDLAARTRPEATERIGPLAKYLIGV
jgi:ectoine hydroxylase-related dioxygenase (phytanoyl-CoA dioxygenase family)